MEDTGYNGPKSQTMFRLGVLSMGCKTSETLSERVEEYIVEQDILQEMQSLALTASEPCMFVGQNAKERWQLEQEGRYGC